MRKHYDFGKMKGKRNPYVCLWKKEVEDRIGAYKAGEMKSVSLERALAKHRKRR